eukprot:TRINITY_DN1072_c0_g1_i5.p1 TRINITY_DN1072_c0_g1~~TRINITY_DN1072_c0_g1_i5.p1  ORF type:complete len:734 (-),score=197.45 TRINITY_DN1072_c0_g1_i5:34-2235(-)
MNELNIQEIQLWPRLHSMVRKAVEGRTSLKIVDHEVRGTDSMRSLERIILESIDGCIRELKKSATPFALRMDDVLLQSIDQVIEEELDPIRHRIGTKTEGLFTDLKDLQILSAAVMSRDCVGFLELAGRIHQRLVHSKESTWAFSDLPEKMIALARKRVYVVPNKMKKMQDDDEKEMEAPRLVLEGNKKWNQLLDIINGIRLQKTHMMHSTSTQDNEEEEEEQRQTSHRSILIFVKNEYTCRELEQILQIGQRPYLEDMFCRWARHSLALDDESITGDVAEVGEDEVDISTASMAEQSKEFLSAQVKDARKRKRKRKPVMRRREESLVSIDGNIVTLMERIGKDQSQRREFSHMQPYLMETSLSREQLAAFHEQFGPVDMEKMVFISPFGRTTEILEEIRPSFVIIYDMSLDVIRSVERFAAENPSNPLEVHTIVYGDSMEKHCFLASVRRESEAFIRLHKLTHSMLKKRGVPEIRDIIGQQPERTRDGTTFGRKSESKVLVDMREFRCALPPALIFAGFKVVPLTLTVGDYVISKSMCVERKSVPDLFQSLDNGRLLQQAKAMQRYYDIPMLLIEFEKGKPFGLQDPSSIPDSIRISNILSKLVILCLNVRKLRLLWSENIDVTPKIFQALKDANREFGDDEPKESVATSMGVDGAGLEDEKRDRVLDHTSVTQEMLEFLLSMPGVNRKNIPDLLKVANSFEEMCSVSESDIQSAIGMEDGATLFKFLHHEG